MSLEALLDEYPKEITIKGGTVCQVRPLEASDESAFHAFFLAVPERERMFIKHRVTDPGVIRGWCANIDYGRNLPLLALAGDRIVAAATLHQQLGGWKRHIGRVSVLVHPELRGRGLARGLVSETVELARGVSLKKVEAEFIGEQEAAMKVFALLGFSKRLELPEYVEDMQGNPHDYILMDLDLRVDEEYAGMG
ncbi:MAG: GNAT family N-acetyltransferase [Verrucomicrobiae bacterium]|nr:GNAT family N-acetyltransferase [Verrucomicrobiae bacterium]